MRSLMYLVVLLLPAAANASGSTPSEKAPPPSLFLYVPHIALASNCNDGYINSNGKLADTLDPNPATRGTLLRCGWETEVRIRNKSARTIHVRMTLHSSDRQPFRVAYKSSATRMIQNLEIERQSLDFVLAGSESMGYTFSPYHPWEPSWTKRLAQDWMEILGISLSPQTKNAWMTIEVLCAGPEPPSDSVLPKDVEATTTYRFRLDGRVATQAAVGTVPPSNRFSYYFSSHMSRKIPWADTGLVVTNPNSEPVKVTIALRDNLGRDRGVTKIRLNSQEQLAAMLGILMQINQDLEGRLTITADSAPVVAIALQESGNKSEMTKIQMSPLPAVDPESN